MDAREITDWQHVLWTKPYTYVSYPGKERITIKEKRVFVPATESLKDCVKLVSKLNLVKYIYCAFVFILVAYYHYGRR